jgi:MFS family permease
MRGRRLVGLLLRRNVSVDAGSGNDTMPLNGWLVLNASCVAMLAVGENSTAIMAALPAISSSLGLDAATREWAVNAYLLCAAAFIILRGEAADKYGSRRSSAAGIALFALASLAIALAQDGGVLVAARALQGLGAAFAVAGTLAAVTEAAPEGGRAGAISSWTGFLMLGFSLGSLIGGVVTHYAGWRLNFWLNVIIMLPAALGWGGAPEVREARRAAWIGLAPFCWQSLWSL